MTLPIPPLRRRSAPRTGLGLALALAISGLAIPGLGAAPAQAAEPTVTPAAAPAAKPAAKPTAKPRPRPAPAPASAPAIRLQGFGSEGGAAPLGGAGGLTLPGGLAAADEGEDYIVAVVDKELVTRSELRARVARIEQDAQRSQATLPPRDALVAEVLELLISERAQLVAARDSGLKVDAAEVDRAVQTVAAQNQISVAELGQQLRKEGLDMARLRDNLRDQILVERARDREIANRVKISDAEVDAAAERLAQGGGGPVQYNIAHLVIALPENASPAQLAEAARQADALLARARAGEPFEALVKAYSASRTPEGGVLGLRPADRLPEPFVAAVRDLKPGELAPQWLRSDAGLHLLKLIDRQDPQGAPTINQTHARHILLRSGPQLSVEAAQQQLARYKREIEAGKASFTQLAREHSQDGSAQAGGELGWAEPGLFVPEFEAAMNALAPGQLSDPVVSRFGVHLIQVLERRRQPMSPAQIRDTVRARLREQKSEQAFLEWVQEARARAYIERRELPRL